jgi:uncharacterized coiled-coil DUF342 family protein
MNENPSEKELREELQEKKKDVVTLRQQLSSLSEEKRNQFQSMKGLRDKIRSHNVNIRSFKKERDDLTDEVRSLKKERDVLNKVTKEKSGLKRDIDERKKQAGPEVRGNPRRIKEEIRQIETKIETEVMSFTKEQQLTKRVKELKIQYKELASLEGVWKEASAITADFSQARRKAQDVHLLIQKKADDSQEKHEQIVKHLETLKALRKEEKPLAEKESELHVKLGNLKRDLDAAQKRITEINKLLNQEEEKSYNQIAKEKTAEVEEKMKKRKKLSTEDILAFQSTKE